MKHLLIILPCLFFPAIGCLGCSHEEPGQNPDKEIPAPPGIVVNHVPKSTETYIGSPSLCILPNGDYIASHDLFGPKANTGKMGRRSYSVPATKEPPGNKSLGSAVNTGRTSSCTEKTSTCSERTKDTATS